MKTESGIGLGGVLLVVFIVLKLCHVIEWSWLWVLAPFWIPFSVAMIVLVVALIMAVVTGQLGKR